MGTSLRARLTTRWLAFVATVALALSVHAVVTRAQDGVAHSFGPSIAGRSYAFALDPEFPNVIYEGGDVNGVYRSDDFGDTWYLWNEGLESSDMRSSFYVDDLLVIPSGAGAANGCDGVYAATLGGIYFRARGASQWTLMTGDLYYKRGDGPIARKGIAVPFCTLVYDQDAQMIYAGAGNGRYRDGEDGVNPADPASYENYSYPWLTAPLDPTGSVTEQHVVWALDISTNGNQWQPDAMGQAVRPTGLARQFAIARTPTGRCLALATSTGIWTSWIDSPAPRDWYQLSDSAPKTVGGMDWSGFVWGIGAGKDGVLYALHRRIDDPTRASGVFWCDYPVSGATNWTALENGQYVPPHDPDYSLPLSPPKTFSDLVGELGSGNAKRLDLCTITVVPGTAVTEDQVFVGTVPNSSYGGYYRYGPYVHHLDEDDNTVLRTGWIRFIYVSDWLTGFGREFHSIDWTGAGVPISDKVLYSASSPDGLGWMQNGDAMVSFVPMARNADGSRLVLDLYHRPMRSDDAGSSWEQIYCTKSGDAWRGSGMNLDTTNDIVVLADGRHVVSSNDFGVFEEAAGIPEHYVWTYKGNGGRTFGAMEVVGGPNGEEIYAARDSSRFAFLMKRNRAALPGATDEWKTMKQYAAATAIGDIVAHGADTLFVALIGGSGGIDRCTRGANGEFGTPVAVPGMPSVDCRALARVQGTNLMLAAFKDTLICFEGDNPSNQAVWMSASYPSTGTAVSLASKDIISLWVDRLARVAYVGSRGMREPGAIGSVVRIEGPFTTVAAPTADRYTALANASSSDHPFDFEIARFGMSWHTSPNEQYTCVRSITTDPNNPGRVYVGLGAPSFDYQGNLHPRNGVWLYDEAHPVNGSAWRQVFGAQGSPSWGRNRPVTIVSTGLDGPQLAGALEDTLLIGTDGQGPFWMPIDVTAPPGIAAVASYPVFADPAGAAHAIGVHVSPAANTTIDTVTVDLRPWGGSAYEPLRDGGVAPDLIAGDGIFTSDLLDLDVGDPGTISIEVFAQASDGGYASRAVSLEVLGNPIGENAVYRFRAGSTDASHVLAVAMTSPPDWAQVTADLTAVAGPASITLSDDGTGEDVKAGDGIYTSPRFAAAMPNAGAYVASVTAVPMVGAQVTQSINMVAVTAAAKFTGDSEFGETERLGDAFALGLTARPYSSVYFRASPNDDESDRVMITTFDDNTTPPGIWGRSLQFDGSAGAFEERGYGYQPSWLLTPLPSGSRGVCYADFDNDGDTDFFLCSPTGGGKLYVNHLNDTSGPEAWRGKFVDRTTEFFGADAAELAGAITASWGDYNGDGFVDLFVAKAFYADPIDEIDELPEVASGFSGGDMRLFRNNMGTGLRQSLVWGSGSSPLCLAACWLDLDNDGDLDLVTTRYMTAGLSVLENHGINAARTDHMMVEVAWPTSVTNLGANSITVIDYDHNAYLDLLVTEYTATRKQAWILRNNYGSGSSKSFAAIGFGLEQAWNGAVVADFNLDGQEDFVLLPKSADVVPGLFVSMDYTPSPEFEEWPAVQPTGEPTTPIYRDLGYTLGIRDGKTGGGFAADLDGDHAPDLFLGRDMVGDQGQTLGEQCLYRSTGTAAAANHWLQVNLRTRGDSNGSLIGTKVAVVANGKQWHKAVDGGSFRGGQGSNDLLFGLGSETSVDHVSVVFPSGETKIISQPAADATLEVWEDDMDVLAYARPASALELQPGFMDWIFRWKTGSIKGDLREDKVEIYPYGGNPEDAVVLQWGAPNVNNVVYREDGVWTHEMHLVGLQCVEGARWTFRVSSSAGTGGETIALSSWSHTPVVTYCLPENYGQ